MRELIGVVLCGGESVRMGRDKGLIRENGVTWARRAANVLNPYMDHIVFSIRPHQRENYTAALPGAELVDDTFTNAGPLCGLISVHQKFPEANLFLLACDMTAVTKEDIAPLVSVKDGITAYRQNGLFEPLCAYYPSAACRKIYELANHRYDKPLGLQQLLQQLQVTAIDPARPIHLKSQNTMRS